MSGRPRNDHPASDELVAAYGRALTFERHLERGHDYTLTGTDNQRQITVTLRGVSKIATMSGPLPWVLATHRGRRELVTQALRALHLFARDTQYLIRDNKIQIVDEYTGRVMPDRSWERGLHQLIEMKEGCPITGHRETLARVTYQCFFRRYLQRPPWNSPVFELTRPARCTRPRVGSTLLSKYQRAS